MKIVNIIQRYPPAVGGSETWCQEVCRFLAKKGHNIKVLTLDVNEEEEYWREPIDNRSTIVFGKMIFDNGITIRRYRRSLPIFSVYHIFYKKILDQLLNIYFYGPHSLEMYGRMWREIKKADIVFLYTLPQPHNFIAFLTAKFLRKKVVFAPFFHPNHPFYERRSNYWLLKHSDSIITLTHFERNYLKSKGVPAAKIYVTGCGIHPEEYAPKQLEQFKSRLQSEYGIRNSDRVITFIGRKIPEKGVGFLIEAVKDLCRDIPLKLFLVGPSFDWYKDLLNSLSSKEKEVIIDLGTISHQEKVNLLHLSDLLVLPSKYESFGIVFLEAWVCNVPVIGTTEGCMPEVIGEGGFLCEYGNTEDLKLKIKNAIIYNNKKRIASRGKERVFTIYNWNIIAKEAEKAMKRALGKKETTMRVVIVSNAYPPHFIGGAELIAHSQAKGLKMRGNDVIVFAGELNNTARRYSIKRDIYEGIPVNRIFLHDQDYSADFFNFYHKPVHESFCNFIENVSPEVVHFHNIIGLSASLIHAAKSRRIKTILTFHDHWGICFKNTLLTSEEEICKEFHDCERCKPSISDQGLEEVPFSLRNDFVRLQLEDIDTFICPSDYLANFYIRAGLDKKKVRVVCNGIDIDRFTKLHKSKDQTKDQTKIRFSFLGYFGRHKGIHILLEALSGLKESIKENVWVNLVGDGDQKYYYERLVKELKLDKLVKFWGKIEYNCIEDIYRQTDVLILPSIWPENQPVTITEAMASRIPVIATRIGGIHELVEEGKTGYLFEPNNPEDLAQKMMEFIFDRSKLIDFGEKAFQKISDKSLPNQVGKIISIYQEESESNKTGCLDKKELIVCLGKKFLQLCSKALNILRKESVGHWQVVMVDWLDESLIGKAKVLWVVDNDVNPRELKIGLLNKLPLLVPESNEKLKNICVKGKCGLFYKNAPEAALALEYLMNDEPLRLIMGQNGFKFFYGSGLC